MYDMSYHKKTTYIDIPKVYEIRISNNKLESETHNYYETNFLASKKSMKK